MRVLLLLLVLACSGCLNPGQSLEAHRRKQLAEDIRESKAVRIEIEKVAIAAVKDDEIKKAGYKALDKGSAGIGAAAGTVGTVAVTCLGILVRSGLLRKRSSESGS